MAAQPHAVLVVENLPVPFDRRVWQEATALRDAGWRVTAISPTGRGYDSPREVRDGIAIRRFTLPAEGRGAAAYAREYGAAFLHVARLLLAVRRAGPIDVLQVCNPPEIFFPFAWFLHPFGGKFVFDHHDLSPELYEAKFGRRDAFYRLLLHLERRTLRAADLVLTTNDSFAKVAAARGGVPPEKIVVVRNGPDLARLFPVPANPGLKAGRRSLCAYVGMMGPQDGIDLLLGAAHHIEQRRGRHDVHFALAGDGPVLDDMRRRAEALGLARAVTFLGRLDDAPLRELLSTADVCVVPDAVNPMNDQSTLVKVMEYMALSKPLVQFDMRESRVSAGEAALYAAPNDVADLGDKILTLVDDPARAARLGAIGRARVEASLAWPHQAQKLVAAYQRLVAR